MMNEEQMWKAANRMSEAAEQHGLPCRSLMQPVSEKMRA